MTLKEAKEYISFGCKEGYYDAEEFESWSDEEIIKFATYEGAKGDYYANEIYEET